MGRLRVAHLRYLAVFAFVAWRSSMAIRDNSFLWHVEAGVLQLEDGQVLTADPFSFTAFGEPWRTQSWLAELGYGWLHQITGGIDWVPAMKFVALGLTLALLGLVVYKLSGQNHDVTIVVLVLLAWQAAAFSVSRPSLLGFVLLAMTIALLEAKKRPLWILPLLFWLWASVHGGFVVGLGYVALDALRRRSKRQLIAAVIAGIATSATAHGLGAWWILLKFAQSRDALGRIAEWQTTDLFNPMVVPFLLVLIGLLVAGAWKRLSPGDLWVAIPFLLYGLSANRNIWQAVMVLTPILVACMRLRPRQRSAAATESVVLNWAIAAVIVGVSLLGLVRGVSLSESRFPSDAALDALEDGRQWNDSAVGGYLIYRSDLNRQVYADDRAELYGGDWYSSYVDMRWGIGVESGLETHGVDQAIVSADWPLVSYLELIGWEKRYEDEYFVVMASSKG